jgi:hypothetical protein
MEINGSGQTDITVGAAWHDEAKSARTVVRVTGLSSFVIILTSPLLIFRTILV